MSRSLFRPALGLFVSLVSLPGAAFAADKAPQPTPEELRARDTVKAALLAEASGDNTGRTALLRSAAEYSPELAEAKWHSGKVQVESKWLTLADAERAASMDSIREEYRQRRDKADGGIKLLRDLARWCVKVGLDDNARLHYLQLLSRPDIAGDIHQEACKRLQLRQVGGTWMTKEDAESWEQRNRAIEQAFTKWGGRIQKLQAAIDGSQETKRNEAIQELSALDDPQIIVVLEAALSYASDRFSEEAAKSLAQFPQYEATQALLRCAVLTPFVGAREVAVTSLKQRPKHDYVPLLMGGLREPIKTKFAIQVSKNGHVRYSHAVLQENAHQRVAQISNQFVSPMMYRVRSGRFEPGLGEGDPGRGEGGSGHSLLYTIEQMNIAAQSATQIELSASNTNFEITDANSRVFDILERTTEQALPSELAPWWDWWQNYNEYYWPKPSYWAYQNQSSYYFSGVRVHSCFLAGTPVRTETGLQPIETIRAGDRVIAQDQDTGELAYKIVLRKTIRPPAKMLRIEVGKEQIVTTLGHPFWVSGHGWKMAKELKAGHILHCLHGAAPIRSVEALMKEEQAHNLVVDDFNTYFVGQTGLLVHDNEFRKPTRAIVPGLIASAESPAGK